MRTYESSMKIGTIDGMSFERSRSHQVQSIGGGYNNLRSHGYAILKLCRKLGVTDLLCTTDSGKTGTELNPADDMAYSLRNEFREISLGECRHDVPTRYGILVQTLIDPKYIWRLRAFVESVDKLFIYSSDYEYELRKNTFNLKFLFEFMRDPGDYQDLVDLIKSKLVVAFCGWYHIAEITPSLLGINCEFFPQIINPNLPQVEEADIFSEKPRPYDGFFMGMNDRTVEFMKQSGGKRFLSIQYRDYSVPHDVYRKVTQVQQENKCVDIQTLVNLASMCKWHCITNSWKNLYPRLEQNSDMFVNQTFKIFEAYYGGMYPINPAQNWDAAHLMMNCTHDRWKQMMRNFRDEMEMNYSYDIYSSVIDKVAKQALI